MFAKAILSSAVVLCLTVLTADAQMLVLRRPPITPPVIVQPTPLPTPLPTPPIIVPRQYLVEYRLPGWNSAAFADYWSAANFADLKRAQGYDARVNSNGWTYEVRFRMQWQLYRTVYSHQDAHQLERWLESRGYDARVNH